MHAHWSHWLHVYNMPVPFFVLFLGASWSIPPPGKAEEKKKGADPTSVEPRTWVGSRVWFWVLQMFRMIVWLFSNIFLNILPEEQSGFQRLCSSSYCILSRFLVASRLGRGGIADSVAPGDGAQPAAVVDKKVDWDGLRWSRMLFIMLRRVGRQMQVAGFQDRPLSVDRWVGKKV